MTRVNVIPVGDLTDQHLLAEYRELPRIFALALAWDRRGRPGKVPLTYRMGAGHVRFFYTRTAWLAKRQAQLIAECIEREFDIQHNTPPTAVPGLEGDWRPGALARIENLGRLREKLAARPGFYRWHGEPVGQDWYA